MCNEFQILLYLNLIFPVPFHFYLEAIFEGFFFLASFHTDKSSSAGQQAKTKDGIKYDKKGLPTKQQFLGANDGSSGFDVFNTLYTGLSIFENYFLKQQL